MVHTFTLEYLRTRSLPELYILRARLQQQLSALPRSAGDRAEVLQVLERIHWLLCSRAPGFRPR